MDYERIRQNYYSDPPINQQRNYYAFNEIPYNGGQPYRSPLADRFSNLDYNGGGRPGVSGQDFRSVVIFMIIEFVCLFVYFR